MAPEGGTGASGARPDRDLAPLARRAASRAVHGTIEHVARILASGTIIHKLNHGGLERR